MKADSRQASAAMALMSMPVLRSAMHENRNSRLVDAAIAQLAKMGFTEGAATMRALIWRCDRWLVRNHRNDLVYRKAVVSQMPSATGDFLAEFRCDRSIADFLAVSDSLHAIEIKSDLDNSTRLEAQLRDYRKLAPVVSLIAPKRLVERISSVSDFHAVGLYWLDERGQLKVLRPGAFNPRYLDSEIMMRSLRRAEYVAVLAALGYPLLEMPNTRVFTHSLEVARSIDPLTFHEATARQLQERKPRAGRSLISRLPAPLRPTVLKLDPSRQQIASLHEWLDQEVPNVHA